MTAIHGYPKDLALFVQDNWGDVLDDSSFSQVLPPVSVLEALISTCYQASLMRHEDTPVSFRLIVADSDTFPLENGPPAGFHRLEFTHPLPLTSFEIRRLSMAANFARSLIGVRIDPERGPEIWGIIHSGPRWLQTLHGGRGLEAPYPDALILSIAGSGHVEVNRGAKTIGQLSDGRVFGPSLNVFQSQWLQDHFAEIRKERLDLHKRARADGNGNWHALDPDLTRVIDQHMMKRIIAAVRAFHHGGTLVMVPPERSNELCSLNSLISIKYKFVEGEPRARFRTLIVAIMNRLAQIGVQTDSDKSLMSWREYQDTNDQEIADLDEAIFEMSHLMAAVSTCDGAVILTKRFELLGFGAEIHCHSAEVENVDRAIDLEGTIVKVESVQAVGTRHRSAYRLCRELPEALVIVISQDGTVQFVRNQQGRVTYWEYQALFNFSAVF